MLALRLVAFLALCLGASLAFFLPGPAAPSQTRVKGGLQMLNLFNSKKSAGAKQKTFTITVQQKFYKDADLVVEGAGTPVNLRKELMKNKIDIYPVQGKIYNCGGGGQCGTCAVKIIKGAQNLNPKSPVEGKALGRKNDDDIRLSCCTRASGDVTIKTKP